MGENVTRESRSITRWYSSHAHNSGYVTCWLMPVMPTHLAESKYSDDLKLCVHPVSKHLAWHSVQKMTSSTLAVMFKIFCILMAQILVHQFECETESSGASTLMKVGQRKLDQSETWGLSPLSEAVPCVWGCPSYLPLSQCPPKLCNCTR